MSAAAQLYMRLSSSMTDAQPVANVVDSAAVLRTVTFSDGTGEGEVNAQWQGKVAIVAGDSETLDFDQLAVALFGGSGSRSLATVKLLYLRNIGDAPVAIDGWGSFCDGPVVVRAGATFVAFEPTGGFACEGEAVTLTNNHATLSAEVDLLIVGVSQE